MQKHDILAIITGGASGLGLAAGESVIAAGGKVALLDINEETRLARSAARTWR
jgi:NAD(P)-dependent dehydrogenase (short-subunit alcohol dehydrogenase family)